MSMFSATAVPFKEIVKVSLEAIDPGELLLRPTHGVYLSSSGEGDGFRYPVITITGKLGFVLPYVDEHWGIDSFAENLDEFIREYVEVVSSDPVLERVILVG